MIIHQVEKDDTIYSISRKYAVSPSKIIEDNMLKNPDKILVGHQLCIPVSQRSHTVRGGETLNSISQKFGVSKNLLLQRNPALCSERTVYPGQILTLESENRPCGSIAVLGFATSNISEPALKMFAPTLTYLICEEYRIDGENIIAGKNIRSIKSIAKRECLATALGMVFDGALTESEMRAILQSRNLCENIRNLLILEGSDTVHIELPHSITKLAAESEKFLEMLYQILKDSQMKLLLSVSPTLARDDKALFKKISESCDILNIMTYECSRGVGNNDTCSSEALEEMAGYARCLCEPHKICVGIPNYAYRYDGEQVEAISCAFAMSIAEKSHCQIVSNFPKSPYFTYNIGAGITRRSCTVRTENLSSYNDKLKKVYNSSLLGISIYNINAYNPDIVNAINSSFNILKPATN